MQCKERKVDEAHQVQEAMDDEAQQWSGAFRRWLVGISQATMIAGIQRLDAGGVAVRSPEW